MGLELRRVIQLNQKEGESSMLICIEFLFRRGISGIYIKWAYPDMGLVAIEIAHIVKLRTHKVDLNIVYLTPTLRFSPENVPISD